MTPQEVVDLLNEALELDSEAITALINARVPINLALADHPTIMSMQVQHTEFPAALGVLGLINGFVAKEGMAVEAMFDDLECTQLVGFQLKRRTRTA
jgi:hypothetical protein